MSGYILCQTKKADKPFFVESINTNIYSLEELCYFLYHNLYLVDSSVINENLCIWISEELDLPSWQPSYVLILVNLPVRRMCFIRYLRRSIILLTMS